MSEGIVKARLDESFQGKVVRFEMKYTYPEIGERDVSISYFPIEGPTAVDRVACIVQDVTDRKRLEKVLTGMSRKLIEAQEQERARIARELHDDINQRLALLTVEVEQVQQDLSALPLECAIACAPYKNMPKRYRPISTPWRASCTHQIWSIWACLMS